MPHWQFALAAVVLLLGLVLGLRVAAWRRSRMGRRVALRGAAGEERALELLAAEGYRVLEIQPRAIAEVEVDGESVAFDLRLDAIVRRGRARYIAEFKTGASAHVGHRATRRQLLEYAVAFPDHGVLLVDATEGTLCEVSFPGLR